MFRRIFFVMTMTVALPTGSVHIRLLAQESEAPVDSSDAARVTSKTAIEFASKLVGEDELTQKFKAALHTEPGALVLRDRAGYYQAMAVENARTEAIPHFFDELFMSAETGLRLRPDKEGFRSEFLAASAVLNEDITELKDLMAMKAGRIDLESDLDKLVHRFMTDDAAPIILYARQLRPRMNPGTAMMEQLFAEQLAKRGDGQYEIRPDAREQIELRLASYDEREKLLRRIKTDLAEFSDEISPVDDLHQRFKAALKDPAIVTGLALPVFEGDRPNGRIAEKIVNQFEGVVREGPEGLVIQDQAKEQIERMLPRFEQVSESADSIRVPFNTFVAKIAEEDELHRKLKQSMVGDVTLIRVASRIQYAASDIETAIDTYFGSMLSENDAGRLSVDTSNVREEQLVGMLSGVFRDARMAKRRGREVTEFTEQVIDPELKAAMLSSGGKMAIGDELVKRNTQSVSNGMSRFVSEHFETSGEGYAIREDRRGEIEEFVKHVGEVQQELENADF